MWNLKLDLLEQRLASAGGFPEIAIETGTCRGNGTRALSRRFRRVISIELDSALHAEAASRLAGPEYPHVELHLGNSAQLLPKVLAALPADAPVFIFLDAHWSGDQSVDWARARWKGFGFDTAHLGAAGTLPSGPEQCPLLSELEAIMRFCRGAAHVLIDDLKNLPPEGAGRRDLEFPGEDWSHLSRAGVLATVRPRLLDSVVLNDPEQWLLSLAPLTP